MQLTSVIIGPVVTEKAERQKTMGTYTIVVHPAATKIDVKNALRKFYDVEVNGGSVSDYLKATGRCVRPDWA